MRRIEHKEEKLDEIEKFLNSMSFGFLGTHSSDNYPNIIPLNFIWAKDSIFFHGARIGRKIQELKKNQSVTFAVADELAIIPSYFIDKKHACPATSFFKSVLIYGKLNFVENLEEKIFVLDRLMKKLQPEGGYDPFNLDDEVYRKEIKGVNIMRISPDSISAKFKFGQNRDEDSWEMTREGLLKRNSPRDMETIENMERTCPIHRNSH